MDTRISDARLTEEQADKPEIQAKIIEISQAMSKELIDVFQRDGDLVGATMFIKVYHPAILAILGDMQLAVPNRLKMAEILGIYKKYHERVDEFVNSIIPKH